MADAGNHFYYYIYNVQGDVIALADADTGKIAATYTYDAWGKCVSIENATGFTVGSDNPFRFKGYYFDSETGLYYLNSRYYDPEVGRFVNADAYLTTNIFSASSSNMFAYCNNNPVNCGDSSGYVVDTIFDILSLTFSIAYVIDNYDDPWAWAGLAGDIVDLIPFITGVGETIKLAGTFGNFVKVKKTDNALESIKVAASNLKPGHNSVYISRGDNNVINYVGITNDFCRRQHEWASKNRRIEPYIYGLDRKSARYVEQAVIETFGMKKAGGILENKINSIAPKPTKMYTGFSQFFVTIK